MAVFSNKIVRKKIPNYGTCYGPKNIYRQYQQYTRMLCGSNSRSDGENSTYVCLNNFYHHSAKCALLDGILEETLKIKAQFKKKLRWKLKRDAGRLIVIKIKQIFDFRTKIKKENKCLK